MLIGNTEITRKDMPSFEDFSNNPQRLYLVMQEQLNNGLQVAALQQQQTINNANSQGTKQNG
jgi:hypothetical protein